jgi:DNA-binding CsgD family transcriptional regulator
MPLSERALTRLIGAAYEAAADPELWPMFLADYALALGATMTFFHLHRFARRTSEVLVIHGMPDLLRHEYHEHYARLNIWRDRGRHLFAQGHVVLDQEICPRSTFERSEFYNDYLLRLDAVYSMTGVIEKPADESLHLTALRDPRRGPWHESDAVMMAELLPHLRRARTIQGRLRLFESGDAANRPSRGAMFLTVDGRCVLADAAAEKIFRSADGLSLRNGVLHADDARADARLQALMRDATSVRPRDASGALVVPRHSLRRAYQVVVAPLRQPLALFVGTQTPGILVLVDDPDERPAADATALIQLYGLTPREADLAGALGTGASVEEAAARLGMRYETARTHLRRIFAKTSTRRQSELVVLLTGVPRASE